MKNNVYPCKPQFYFIKVGFMGSKLYRHVFVMNSNGDFNNVVLHYENTPILMYRKFHLQKLKIFR